MSHYFLCSQNKHSKNRRHFQCIVSDFVAAEFPTVRTPPAFLPRPLLRAGQKPRQGESISPSQMFRPAESALVFRIFRKMGSDFFKRPRSGRNPRACPWRNEPPRSGQAKLVKFASATALAVGIYTNTTISDLPKKLDRKSVV